MLFCCRAIDENIILKYQYKSPEEGLKNLVHHTLKCCWCIGQAKRHDLELIMALMSFKSCLVFILWEHPHLMVTRPHVMFSEYFSSGQLIQNFLNNWHRKCVLCSDIIQFSVINTKSLGAIFFFTSSTRDANGLWL